MVTGAAAAIAALAGAAVVATVREGGEDGSPRSGAATSPVAGTAGCTYLPKADSGLRNVGTPPSKPPSPAPRRATITTSLGTLEAELDAGKAPCTVNSFAYLAGRLFFDGTACHRVTTDPGLQVLQCGDPTGTRTGGPTYRYADENTAARNYTRGVLAMANAGPDTNGSQFFIVHGTAKLPGGYTIFGRVTSGMEVVDRVARAGAEDQNGPGDGRPKQKITITALRTR
ncbi:peptidylprolyl isomerase [Spirillospora albida]|uniref:peptidylprolyl isomerase n=1 Tax=Spirillospora albida TaxID=58123 RepID=UPI0005666593|nr:peptidylprolyl isomerase [Spirillospora albida]